MNSLWHQLHTDVAKTNFIKQNATNNLIIKRYNHADVIYDARMNNSLLSCSANEAMIRI